MEGDRKRELHESGGATVRRLAIVVALIGCESTDNFSSAGDGVTRESDAAPLVAADHVVPDSGSAGSAGAGGSAGSTASDAATVDAAPDAVPTAAPTVSPPVDATSPLVGPDGQRWNCETRDTEDGAGWGVCGCTPCEDQSCESAPCAVDFCCLRQTTGGGCACYGELSFHVWRGNDSTCESAAATGGEVVVDSCP